MPRPTHAVLSLPALQHNLAVLRQLVPHAQCLPVVKANAYGHGLLNLLPVFLQEAKHLAGLMVLEIEQAIVLRCQGWQQPIVLLEGCFGEEDFLLAAQHKLDWVLHSQAQWQCLQQTMAKHPHAFVHKTQIYLKLNTGMNRLGFDHQSAAPVVQAVEALVQQHGWPTPVLMTHFANADACNADEPWVATLSADAAQAQGQPHPALQHQRLMAIKPAHWPSSLANSAGILNTPQWAGNLVRPGIALYGAKAGPKPAQQHGLKAVMALRSEIIAVQTVAAGQAVGYGSRWVASRPSRIGVVACGYADGYPRHAPDGTPVWVQGAQGGVRVPLVGRVSMDMLMVDLTDQADVVLGSPVELWGDNLPVDEVAEHAGTLGYELLCALAPRVPVHIKA